MLYQRRRAAPSTLGRTRGQCITILRGSGRVIWRARALDKANLNKDLSRAQVFETRQFAPLVRKLQASAAAGKGAVATTRLTTVKNSWWGVDGGREVTVTWMYITRVPQWEAKLPKPVQRALPDVRSSNYVNPLGDASRAGPLDLSARSLLTRRGGGRVSSTRSRSTHSHDCS